MSSAHDLLFLTIKISKSNTIENNLMSNNNCIAKLQLELILITSTLYY